MKSFMNVVKGFFDTEEKKSPIKDLPGMKQPRTEDEPEKGHSEAYLRAKEQYERVYDELEKEYGAVLEILREKGRDREDLKLALMECERKLTHKLKDLRMEGDELEQRAGEKMGGNTMAAMLGMFTSFMDVEDGDDAEAEVKSRREGKIQALNEELKTRKNDFGEENAERIERIGALLESLTLVEDVFGKMDQVF